MAEWSKQPESRGLPCAVAEPLSSGAAGHQLTAANSLKTHPLSWHPLQKNGDMHWLEGARIQCKAPGNFFGGRLATLSLAQPYEVEAFSAENTSIYCPARRGQASCIPFSTRKVEGLVGILRLAAGGLGPASIRFQWLQIPCPEYRQGRVCKILGGTPVRQLVAW